jgi:hypothetical protein
MCQATHIYLMIISISIKQYSCLVLPLPKNHHHQSVNPEPRQSTPLTYESCHGCRAQSGTPLHLSAQHHCLPAYQTGGCWTAQAHHCQRQQQKPLCCADLPHTAADSVFNANRCNHRATDRSGLVLNVWLRLEPKLLWAWAWQRGAQRQAGRQAAATASAH